MATPADAAALQAIYAPMVLDTVISFELTPPTVDERASRYCRDAGYLLLLVAESEGKVVGKASNKLIGERRRPIISFIASQTIRHIYE